MRLRLQRAASMGVAAAALLAGGAALAQHPGPQPLPAMSMQTTSPDGGTTFVTTARSLFGNGDSELAYVPRNARDGNGAEMPNTLPSAPDAPFNLHAAPVAVQDIDKTSPRDDIRRIIDDVRRAARSGRIDRALLQEGIDIMEGNPLPNRAYSGFAMLHYTAGERVKKVLPVYDAGGALVGGEVTVRQIWFYNQIESDAALIDPSAVPDVPWTVNYVIDVLNGGADDFAPFNMYFDAPPAPGAFGGPHIGVDASFYPMSDGKRYVIKVKQAPAKYYKLTYTWGWRKHPPRIQAMENALQSAGGLSFLQWETNVFGVRPRATEAGRLAAIAQIGDLAPAKRIWQAFRQAMTGSLQEVTAAMSEAAAAFDDWSDRTRLPRGVTADPTADVTLLYVNNTIYGSARTLGRWTQAGDTVKVALLNGDRFPHAYMAVDFGGVRGWENQYQDAGGPASSHTFGRAHWWPLAGPIMVPPPGPDGRPGRHRVEMTMNFALGERLKLYQFDPLHHDVAIYSLH